MSRLRISRAAAPPSFPRVSGDEPLAVSKVATSLKFSPRERG